MWYISLAVIFLWDLTGLLVLVEDIQGFYRTHRVRVWWELRFLQIPAGAAC